MGYWVTTISSTPFASNLDRISPFFFKEEYLHICSLHEEYDARVEG